MKVERRFLACNSSPIAKILNSMILCFVVLNGEHVPRPHEGERKRNYKLIIDPVLKGRGHQKIYRFDGEFDGVSPVLEQVDSPNLHQVPVL